MVVKLKQDILYNAGGIFALFLLIAANYSGELFSTELRILLNNSYAKHLIAFGTLYFFVILINPSNVKDTVITQFVRACCLYVIFIFIVKSEGRIAVLSLLLLGIMYIIRSSQIYNTTLDDDNISASEDKEEATLSNKMLYVIAIILVLSIISGIIINIGYRTTYKNRKWDWIQFFFSYDKERTTRNTVLIPLNQFPKYMKRGIYKIIGQI
jgi:hypothetical protein